MSVCPVDSSRLSIHMLRRLGVCHSAGAQAPAAGSAMLKAAQQRCVCIFGLLFVPANLRR